MTSKPLVSVLMPVRDGSSTLPIALGSIFSQTLGEWELVAVDDGSQDDTARLLDAAARADSRVRVLTQGPEGITVALQSGCALCRGEFIARMDADDCMSPERLERQVRFLEDHPRVGLVSCLIVHGGDEISQAGYAAHVHWLNSLITIEQLSLRRFVESPVAHPSVLFRRELLAVHGGYRSGDFPEDYELWLRWMDAGVQFGKVELELLTWNDSGDRLSRTESRYRADAFYRVKCHYLARWLRRQVDTKREVWLWGAGRVTRNRFRALEQEGVAIHGFVDIDAKKIGPTRDGRRVVSPEHLPNKRTAFIVVGVGMRGARDLISAALSERGWQEGIDYLLAA